MRTCLVATHLARTMDLPEPEVRDVYYTALLQHIGCTAPAHEGTYLFGDDLTGTPQAERTDATNPREALALLAVVGRGTGANRIRYLARTVVAGQTASDAIMRSVCEVGVRMAERPHMGVGVRTGVFHSLETWDGKAGPHRLSGAAIALPARLTAVAAQAAIFDRMGGPAAAIAMVRRRSGRWFDPHVAAIFERVGRDVLLRLAEADVWEEVLEAEPQPARRIPQTRLDDVARTFGDMVDLKTPFTLRHSVGVAELAETAAGRLGFAL